LRIFLFPSTMSDIQNGNILDYLHTHPPPSLSGHSWMSNNCNYFTFHGWIRFPAQSRTALGAVNGWKESESNYEKKSRFNKTIACWDNKTMLFYTTLLCFATLIARSTNSVELADEINREVRIEFLGPFGDKNGIFKKKFISLLLSIFSFKFLFFS